MARSTRPAPALLVPVALILLIWHGVFAADYIATRFDLLPEGPGIMRFLPLSAMWLKVAWGLAVWLGFGAAFFMTLRDNASVLLFFAATVAALVVAGGLWTVATPALPIALPVLLAPMIALPFLGWLYARAQNREGVLN